MRGAASLIPGLLDDDGEPNSTAIAEYCKNNGHDVSQPTIHRHLNPRDKPRALSDEIAKALSAVFGVPERIWKGEPLSDDEVRMLTQVGLPALLLAQKIQSLSPRETTKLLTLVEEAAQNDKMRHELDRNKDKNKSDK